MTISVGVSSTYKAVNELFVGVGGNWKTVAKGWVGVSGTWKEFYTATEPSPPFVPFTSTYTSGSGTENVPEGATQLVLYVYGQSEGGGSPQSVDQEWADGEGGDGGARAIKTIAIAESDWGDPLSYIVGSDWTSSSVTGTINAGSIGITVNTNASGGDTNVSGSPGTGGGTISGPGGDGGAGVDGIANGGTGAAGDQYAMAGPGDPGRIEFRWT